MKYDAHEVLEYLPGVYDAVSASLHSVDHNSEASEKIKTKEFAELCRDLVLSFQSIASGTYEDEMEKLVGARNIASSEKIVHGYLFAIGVVAASPFLPEKIDALAYTGKMIGTKFHRELFPVIEDAHRHLIKIDKYRFFSVIGETKQFNDSVAGELMLSELTTMLGTGWEKSDWFIKNNLPAFSDFFEKYEKTRSYSPVWDRAASWINLVYTGIAEDSSIGRKNPDVAKVLRLTKDGADLVSVSECVEATKNVFLGLVHPERSGSDVFARNLDILDDHKSFYAVAFQSELLGHMHRGGGVQQELTTWPHETRDNFRKNLLALAQRMEGKVADADIILCSLLQGNDIVDSMTAKDRAQGKPMWLESSLLENARNPRQLMDPNSAISVVMDTLLSRYEPDEVSAFWKENTGGDRYISERYRNQNLSDDQGYGR